MPFTAEAARTLDLATDTDQSLGDFGFVDSGNAENLAGMLKSLRHALAS